MALQTQDFTKVLIDQALLIVALEKELNDTQARLNAATLLLEKAKAQGITLGDREGSTDVPKTDQ